MERIQNERFEMGQYIATLVGADRDFALSLNKALDSMIQEKKIPVSVQRRLIKTLSAALSSITEGRH